MSRPRAWGGPAQIVLFAFLAGSCQKENPGLLLKISVAPSQGGMTAAAVAGLIGQVAVTIKPTAAGNWPVSDPTMPPGLKGITVQSSAAGDTITLDQAGGFLFSESFELLLQPQGTNDVQVNVDARVFDTSGAQIGKASMAVPATLQPKARTTASLQLSCTRPDCSPAKGIVDLSSPSGVTIQQYTGAAKSDKMTALATGRLLPGSTGNLVAGVRDKTVSIGGKTLSGAGEVYIFKSQNLQDSTGPIAATSADVTIIGRDSEAIGTAAAIGDIDGGGAPDLVVTGVSATRPYCDELNQFTVPPAFPTSCTTDLQCSSLCSGATCNMTTNQCSGGSGHCFPPSCTGDGECAAACPGARCNMGSCGITTTGAGVAYVIFGEDIAAALVSQSLPLTINLNDFADSSATGPYGNANHTLFKSPFKRTVRIYGAGSQENMGTAVTVANNSDLVLTALAGAPLASTGMTGKIGRVYVVSGGNQIKGLQNQYMTTPTPSGHMPTILLGDVPQPALNVTIIAGPGGASQIGRAVAAGDIDGDGRDDLLIGDNTDGTMSSGTAFVIHAATLAGAIGMPGTLDLMQPTGYDAKLTFSRANAFFGYSVALGDLEGLGHGKDVIIGARQAQQVFVIPGAKVGPRMGLTGTTVDVMSLSPLIYKSASTMMTSFGNSLAVGALVDPTRQALLIGAPDDPGLANDRAHAGAVYVVTDIGGPIAAGRTSSSFDLAIYGAATGDQLGDHLFAGTLDSTNNNQLAICGAANASTAQFQNAGITYALDTLPTQ